MLKMWRLNEILISKPVLPLSNTASVKQISSPMTYWPTSSGPEIKIGKVVEMSQQCLVVERVNEHISVRLISKYISGVHGLPSSVLLIYYDLIPIPIPN